MTSWSMGIPAPTQDGALNDLLSVAERAVETARSRGADAAEAFVQTGTGKSFSVEKNAIGFTSTGGEAGVGLRVLKDRRIGFAYFSDPGERGGAIDRALDVARRMQETRFVFPGVMDHPVVARTYDPLLAEVTAEDGLAAVRELIAGARGVHKGVTVSGGAVGVGASAVALVNSEGLEFAERSTGFGASAYVVLKEGDSVTTGFEGHESTMLDDVARDPAAIGRKAAELARDSLHAQPFGAGRPTTVVFHPDATASLIEFLVLPALHGDKAARGESVWSGMLDKEVVDGRLRIVDDPTRDGGLGSAPADDEGVASRPVPLLEGGRVRNFLFDLGSAYEYGDGFSSATASAVRAGGLSDDQTYQEAPTTGARNVVIGATGARRLDQVIADIDDGVLVHDLLGAHTGNPTSGDFSVSSTVLFRIQDGALAGALEGVMLAGNVPRLLRDGFRGASTETRGTSGHFSPVCLEAAYLALDGVQVVGS